MARISKRIPAQLETKKDRKIIITRRSRVSMMAGMNSHVPQRDWERWVSDFRAGSVRGGFTLIELLVVIAIIAILASLLFPGIARAKDKGKTAKCQSNFRQLTLAATMFDQDNGVYPITWGGGPAEIWYQQLQPYVGKTEKVQGRGVFVCPSSMQRAQSNEGIGRALRDGGFWGWLSCAQNGEINNGKKDQGSKHVEDPVSTILYADTDGWDAALYYDGHPTANVCYRHSGGNERSAAMERGVAGKKGAKRRANAAFADTHVELRRDAPRRLFTLARD
jgi:prepilin-type N-terminal cleavage/methylation domain-containing protein/prepilin-type processing-associated H-X9-DG protein